jgi:hypothetical protein
MGNCEVYAKVDFGHGSVEIRCTQVGDHETHKCEVIILDGRTFLPS